MQCPNYPIDHSVICRMVHEHATVLDLGCGTGDLLYMLSQCKKTKGQGIELSEEAIYQCVEKGISVFHGDIEQGLKEYPDKTFDYVILNQSMQELRNVDFIVHEALRVGHRIIIGFPNFAYYRSRVRLAIRGRVPMTPSLPYHWYDTPNVHFLSINDFIAYCKEKHITIVDKAFVTKKKRITFLPNLCALNAIFLLTTDKRIP